MSEKLYQCKKCEAQFDVYDQEWQEGSCVCGCRDWVSCPECDEPVEAW